MFSALAPAAALNVASVSRPYDPHVGYVVVENRITQQIGPFWDRQDCEFVGKGIVNHAFELIFRPYQTGPDEALRLMTTEVICQRRSK